MPTTDPPRLCGSCKHWGDDRDEGNVFRECQAVIHMGGIYSDEFTKDNPAKAGTCDDSSYHSALRCREDFGCVLHEVNG